MPRRSRISARAAAFHEAAHAVARLHVGAPATAVQITPRGITHGPRRWPCPYEPANSTKSQFHMRRSRAASNSAVLDAIVTEWAALTGIK